MLEILVAGAIGVLYTICLKYNLDYSENASRKAEKRKALRDRENLVGNYLTSMQNRQEPEEQQKPQKPIILIKDSKVYLVKGGSRERE